MEYNDPIVIAFPLAFIVTLIVTLATKPMPKEIIEKAFARGTEQISK